MNEEIQKKVEDFYKSIRNIPIVKRTDFSFKTFDDPPNTKTRRGTYIRRSCWIIIRDSYYKDENITYRDMWEKEVFALYRASGLMKIEDTLREDGWNIKYCNDSVESFLKINKYGPGGFRIKFRVFSNGLNLRHHSGPADIIADIEEVF